MAIKGTAEPYAAKKHRDKLEGIKSNIEDSYKDSEANARLFHRVKSFVFGSTLTEADRGVLSETNKPELEFNVLEAYISRLRGEFSSQKPSIIVKAQNGDVDAEVIDVIQAHMRSLMFEANNNQFENEVYNDQLGGGYSVMKIWTEYSAEKSFDQSIKIGKCYDPTMCGFDSLARLPHKGDGEYCFELFPKSIEEFKQEYPKVDIDQIKRWSKSPKGFPWYYRDSNNKKVLLLCDYYAKKTTKKTIVEMADGKVLFKDEMEGYLNKLAQNNSVPVPPDVKNERTTDVISIVRYRLMGDEIVEYTDTSFKSFPLIFVDGNSQLLKDTTDERAKQVTRPYIYNAIDSQRLKNFIGITLANEVENLPQHKYMADKESISPDQEEDWSNPQKVPTLLYNSLGKNNRELGPPTAIPRQPIPPELFQSFVGSDQTIEAVLGAYNPSVGLSNNAVSGNAIFQGATVSNAASKPYLTSFLAALNQMAQIILELIPKYYVTPRTIPIQDMEGKRDYVRVNDPNAEKPISMDYDTSALGVKVEAGVNFEIQKNKSLQVLTQVMKSSQGLAAFMDAKGWPMLLDNMDIVGIDKLKVEAENYIEEQEEKQASAGDQPTPEQISAQIEQQKAKAEQQMGQAKIQIENAKLRLQKEKQDADFEIAIEKEKTERMRLAIAEKNNGVKALNEAARTNTDREKSVADVSLKMDDQTHNHAMDHRDRLAETLKPEEKPTKE